MPKNHLLLCLIIAHLLAGCGLRVPDIQEIGEPIEGQRFVQAILTNIACELRSALNDLHSAYPEGTFIDGFGIQTTLTLTYDEKGTLAPGVTYMPPSPATAIFTLGGGLNLSSQAIRTNRIDGYYLVSELQQAKCSEAARPNGPFLLQSDLKLSEWLFDAVSAEKTQTIDFKSTSLADKQSVLQHQIKFVIDTGGSITPTWKLTRVTVNPSGNLLSLNRTRTNDLIITLGPADTKVIAEKKKGGRKVIVTAAEPVRRAADLHLSATVANGIETALRSALQP